jgi:hypothetical protein
MRCTTDQIASVGALLDHLIREQAVSALEDDGIDGLDIRGIETLALYVLLSNLSSHSYDIYCQ